MNDSRQTHTPSPVPSSPSSSKLPKFLQKQVLRERSASRNDPNSSSGSTGTPISAASTSSSPAVDSQKPRKSSKFLSISKDKDDNKSRKSSSDNQTPASPQHVSDSVDDPPVIVEPVAIPRPRTRSERTAETHHSLPSSTLYSSTSSTTRIGDLPNRLSGWFHHTFSTSSTDLSALLAQQAVGPAVTNSRWWAEGRKGPECVAYGCKTRKGPSGQGDEISFG
jgi:cysteine protease ATG4